jgi:hypothetical protein
MGAQVKCKREECASGMEQKSNDAVLMDALILHKEKEFARDTEPIRMVPRGPISKLKTIWKEAMEALYLPRILFSDDDAGGTQPQGVDRKGKAAEKQSITFTSNRY